VRYFGRILACAVATLLVAPLAWSAILYEPFEYNAGAALSGQTDTHVTPSQTWNFVGAAGTVDPTIGSGNLNNANLPASSGNMAVLTSAQAASSRINLPSAVTSGTLYYSMLLNVPTFGAGFTNTTTGSFLAGFNSATGAGTNISSAAGALLIHLDPANSSAYNLGVGSTTNNADRIFDTNTHLTAGSTVFVVVAHTLNAGTDDDVSQLWINPDSSTFGTNNIPAPNITSSSAASAVVVPDSTQIASFFLRNNSVEPSNIQVDEVRVDTSWAGVTGAVPEPEMGALALSLGALLGIRRRR
jgi:hypothetical protein